MPSQTNWRIPIKFNDWMMQVEKRLSHEERRPVPTAETILGPGFGPYSSQLMDWNDPAAVQNGFWYSAPGALNSPDPSNKTWWMGRTQGIDALQGYGVQWATQFIGPQSEVTDPTPDQVTSPTEYVRRFYDPHIISGASPSATTVVYTPWQSSGTPVGTILILTFRPPPDCYLPCDGQTYDPVAYPLLYAVVGTRYGGTTAAPLLPDLRNRFPRYQYTQPLGFTEGQTDPNLRSPNHTHTATGLTTPTGGGHTHSLTLSNPNMAQQSDTAVGGAAVRLTGGGATHVHLGSTADNAGGATHSHNVTGSTGSSVQADFPFICFLFAIKAA